VSRSTVTGPSTGPFRHNDTVSLNPSGQESVDNSTTGKVKNFLRCKKEINIASLNTRTLRGTKEQLELSENMKKMNIQIMGIQEHRIVHPDTNQNVMYHKIGDCFLATSTTWRNSAQAAVGGVGIAMNKTAKRALTSISTPSERIIQATFQSNPVTTVISAYAPTSASSEEVKQGFYRELSSTISAVPAHNFLIVLGDFNGRLGNDVSKNSFHKETNQSGEMLRDLMEEHAHMACSIQFQKGKNKQWTWHSPPDAQQVIHKQQIDYILARKKWRNSIHDAQAYNSFASVGSDHRVVKARIRLSLRVPKSEPNKKRKYIWRALENDPKLQERYAVTIKNKFQMLHDEPITDV
jgi:exonuclease III